MATKKEVQTVHSIEVTVEAGEAATRDTPAKPPKTRTLAPGTLLKMTAGDDLDALIEAGAVKEPDGKHTLDLTGGFEDGQAGQKTPRHPQFSKPANPGAGANPAPASADETDEEGKKANSNDGKTPAAAKTPKAS